MNTRSKLALVLTSLTCGAFFAGVAIGKTSKAPKFVAKEELKWVDLGGPKMGSLVGDAQKGAYMGLLILPGGAAGFTSPLHTHSGDYEAIQITGTSSHWLKGEDGSKAKKMTPGSYWSMPGKLEHVSQCEKGAECTILVIQKTKFDFAPGKEDKAAAPAAKDAAAPAAKEPAKKTP
jgi:Domain of unknown function (DUF4437)